MSSIAAIAQGPTATPPDISGYWELPLDGRHIPPARLASSVTPARLRLKRTRTQKPFALVQLGRHADDDGRRAAVGHQTGTREIVIVAESPVTPVRHLYLDRTAHISKDIFDPTTSGDSIARWDGNTLVVDTTGFEPTHGVTAIPGGGFRTATSHLVERYRLLKNGRCSR